MPEHHDLFNKESFKELKKSGYSEITVKAVSYINEGYTAEEAWEKSSCELFVKGSSMQKNSSPRGAFLGLFSKDQKKLTSRNAFYAQKVLTILKNSPNKKFKSIDLWMIVLENNFIKHNYQMDVVLALWENKLI